MVIIKLYCKMKMQLEILILSHAVTHLKHLVLYSMFTEMYLKTRVDIHVNWESKVPNLHKNSLQGR